MRRDEHAVLPADLNYGAVPGLSNEMIDRLCKARPSSLGAASRVQGVTPAALVMGSTWSNRRPSSTRTSPPRR